MEIIQASGSCRFSFRALIHSSPRYQLSRNSTGIHVCSGSILSVKPRVPSRSCSLSATTTCTARAILDNTSSSSDLVATETVETDKSLAIKKKASEISPDLKGTSLFLVGVNSFYKSTLGRILADALRYYYFDSDSLVEEAAGGKSAALSLIDEDVEGHLASETEVLKQLSSMGRLVVCAGNGAVKSATNLALLRHGISIWVDVPLDMVARDLIENRIQLSASDTTICRSSLEVMDQLILLYNSGRSGYSTADATVSLQSESMSCSVCFPNSILSLIFSLSLSLSLYIYIYIYGAEVASVLGYGELDAVTAEDLCMEVLKEIERLLRVKKMMEEAARPF